MTETIEWHLRRASKDDLDDMYRLICTPEVYRYLYDGNKPEKRNAQDWLDLNFNEHTSKGMGVWLLRNREDQLAGIVSLQVCGRPDSAEIVYALHPDHWGQGLATRMAWTIITHAFETTQITEILAGFDEPNVASGAVINRLGMTFFKKVQYTLGPGLAYLYKKTDPAPTPEPGLIPIID